MLQCYLTEALREETVKKVSCSISLLICVQSQGSPGPAGLKGEKGGLVCCLLYFTQSASITLCLKLVDSHVSLSASRDLKDLQDHQEKW